MMEFLELGQSNKLRNIKSYLANGLFSESERAYNSFIADKIRGEFPDLDLYLPQENFSINDKSSYASSEMIASGDDEHLLKSDFLIAVIDGVEIDSGVACEIGSFSMLYTTKQLKYGEHAPPVTIKDKPKPIFALFTDSRQQGTDNKNKIDALISDPLENQYVYRNLYVVGKIKKSGGGIYSSVDDLIEAIKEWKQKTT
jgi:Nucleoside 2-deoxyribosyltransferase